MRVSSTRPGTESGDSSRSARALGVTHPAHSLVRGNAAMSRTATSWPFLFKVPAQVEPAGPPPTTMVSYVCMDCFFPLLDSITRA